MKKNLFAAVAFVMALAMNSCKPIVTGDFIYTIKPAPETSTGASRTWQMASLGEAKIDAEMEKSAKPLSSVWIINGNKADCDKLVKNAVEKAISDAENDPEYCSLLDLSGITIVVYNSRNDDGESSGSGSDGFEIYRRTYKNKK